MKKNALITVNSLVMFKHAIVMVLIGPMIPELMEAFHVGESQIGILLAVGALGFTLSPFTGGLLLDKRGVRLTLLLALAAEIVFLILFGFSRIFLLSAVLYFGLLFSGGNTEAAANYMPTLLTDARPGPVMNLVHFFFSVGAFVTPFAIGLFLERGGSWNHTLFAAAVPAFLLGTLLLFIRIPRHHHEETSSPHISIGKSISHPSVILGAVTLFLYVGAELGFSNWLVNYGESRLGFSKLMASAGTSLLWIGIMAGRLLNIFLSRSVSARLLNTISCAAAMVAGVVFLFLFRPLFFYLAIIVNGIGMGGIYPNTMGEINRRFPGRAGAVTGFMTFGAGLGSMVIQWIMGYAAEHAGLRMSMLIPPIMMAAAGIAFFIAVGFLREKKGPEEVSRPL